ncbi:DUF2079 domain-containing protein [Pleurocapsa sp. PCC 7327]|uniref:DUF2079 domain-containing protein n=1 Tax=Pleurocapsa sp. PCC 7327 TaxID=118163 RepID=UPI0002DF9775|nr:DUF2079 domain-containing protein [Pleurocapsa sp. PCC 7327]
MKQSLQPLEDTHSSISLQLNTKTLGLAIAASSLFLFLCSSIRHTLFRSGAFDLGIFDQAVYLISQGQPPISSFLGVHILGDHASSILYPLSLFYKIYPDVRWLLAVQAVALALGALPAWALARQAGLKQGQAVGIAAAYLMYPVIPAANLFDFHPEVIAIPALLGAVLAARLGKTAWFVAAIVLFLSCKEILSLTVAAMGVWLFVFEKRRLCGAIAIFSGCAWFLIATQAIIPSFTNLDAGIGTETGMAAGMSRYAYLGGTLPEIAKNLLLKPHLVLERVLSLDTLRYLAFLALPVIWGLSIWDLAPLIGDLQR